MRFVSAIAVLAWLALGSAESNAPRAAAASTPLQGADACDVGGGGAPQAAIVEHGAAGRHGAGPLLKLALWSSIATLIPPPARLLRFAQSPERAEHTLALLDHPPRGPPRSV